MSVPHSIFILRSEKKNRGVTWHVLLLEVLNLHDRLERITQSGARSQLEVRGLG